ncbi:hypothetical protein MLD52_08190 [Puniceicoccaceae bacterium K14]|nr:hypothetical protein [Puniceicoccaceae bacterium K14]
MDKSHLNLESTMLNSPKPKHMLRILFLFISLLTPQFSLVAAQTLSGDWTGLDKSNNRGQLREVTLSLNPAPQSEMPQLPRHLTMALGELETQILTGEMIFTVPGQRNHKGYADNRPVQIIYFPEIDILHLYFKTGNRINFHNGQVGIIDPKGKSLALFHTGMAAKNALPYVLSRGNSVDPTLKKLAGLSGNPNARPAIANPINIIQAQQQQRQAQKAAQQTQQAIQKAVQQYLPKIRELQQDMAKEMQARNYERAQEIQLEIQELSQTLAAIQRGEIPEDSGISIPKQKNGCPEHILNWTDEVQTNGDTHQEFVGLTRVANLFRDDYFVPHFDKPFRDFNKQQAMKVAQTFQLRCLVPNTPLYHSRVATSLSGAFKDIRGFGRFDAASAAMALDILANWQDATTQTVAAKSNLATTEAYETQRATLANALWPKEQTEAADRMVSVIYAKVNDAIHSELDTIISQLRTSDTKALQNLAILLNGELFRKITPQFSEEFFEGFWSKADPALSSYLGEQLENFASTSTAKDTLSLGKKWYESYTYALPHISDRPVYQNFVKQFSAQRESAYQELNEEFSKQITALENRQNAVAFGNAFSISLDNSTSPTWRGIKALKEQRIKEIDWDAYLARVGDGPFGPHYPGAIYLNALYRGDTHTINQEDSAYQAQLIEFVSPMFEGGAIDALGTLFSGGLLKDFKLSDLFISKIKDTHAYDSLLAYLVVNYTKRYSNCVGRPTVVIPVTTIYYTVQTWSDGYTNRWENDRVTNYHTVLEEHQTAWRQFEGNYSSPEELRFANMLGKFLTPQAKELNFHADLANTIEGLEKAMSAYPCDHDVIQTLEKNLLALFNDQHPTRTSQVRTSWKNQYKAN